MQNQAVNSKDAPAAIGAYSQAMRSGPFIFLSGQVGIDPTTGEMVDGGVFEQMQQVIANIRAVLAAGGSGLDRVVKATIYLRHMSDFAKVNEIYREAFDEPYPARAVIAVAGLPLDALVEMELIAGCE